MAEAAIEAWVTIPVRMSSLANNKTSSQFDLNCKEYLLFHIMIKKKRWRAS